MKYIRTKDGLLIAPGLYDNGGVVLTSDPPMYETRNAKNEWGCVFCHNVINQADTIEELCDEFVYVMKSGQHICKNKHTDIMYCFNGDEPISYYGAIWTDKGLIYVAKMNEKGELELL